MINIIQLGSNTGKDHVTDFIEYYIDIIDKVLLVEALPQLADKLRDNYKGYNTDISVHSCAVSNKNGTADFYFLENTNLRLSSLLPNIHSDFMRGTSKITVPTLTFDSLCAKHGRPSKYTGKEYLNFYVHYKIKDTKVIPIKPKSNSHIKMI